MDGVKRDCDSFVYETLSKVKRVLHLQGRHVIRAPLLQHVTPGSINTRFTVLDMHASTVRASERMHAVGTTVSRRSTNI